MNPLILNKGLSFCYNPFGGISDSELALVIIPHSFTNEIQGLIQKKGKLIIELVGAKGRGKTSHLKLIQQQNPTAPIFLLSNAKKFDSIRLIESNLIFIDSIHHLSFRQRLILFKQNRTIVLTTHSRRFLEYKIAGAAYKSYPFKGINPKKLKTILQNRIGLATNTPPNQIILDQSRITKLIQQFNDNYRGILNYLYENFDQ